MNNSSCGNMDKTFEHRVLPSLYVFVFLVGLVANILGLRSLKHKWKKLGSISVFVLNLGLADLLYILVLPFLIVYYFNEKWIFSDIFCKVTRFCYSLNLYCSIGFLTCISVYRYLTIARPVKAFRKISTKLCVVISVIIWTVVGAQSLPDIFFPKNREHHSEACYETTSEDKLKDYIPYFLGWSCIGFWLPFFITVGCYGHLIVFLHHKNLKNKAQKKRILKLLLILIILFSVCYLPYNLFKIVNLHFRVQFKNDKCNLLNQVVFNVFQTCRGLVCLNSALNPLIYYHADTVSCAYLRQQLRCDYSTTSDTTQTETQTD